MKKLLSRIFRASLLSAAMASSSGAFALAPMPTSGTCAMLGNFVYSFAYQYGTNPGQGWGLNILATLEFASATNATLKGVIVLMNPNANNSTQANVGFSAPITIAAVPALGTGFNRLSGTATITGVSNAAGGTTYPGITIGDTFPLSFNVVPVNNSSTLLVQMRARPTGEADGTWTGVCQF